MTLEDCHPGPRTDSLLDKTPLASPNVFISSDLLQTTSTKHSESDSLVSVPRHAENECFSASLNLPYIDEGDSSTTELPQNTAIDVSGTQSLQDAPDARSCTPQPSQDVLYLYFSTVQSPKTELVVDDVTAIEVLPQNAPDARSSTREPPQDVVSLYFSTCQSAEHQTAEAVTATVLPQNTPDDLSATQPPQDHARSSTLEPSQGVVSLYFSRSQSAENQTPDAVTTYPRTPLKISVPLNHQPKTPLTPISPLLNHDRTLFLFIFQLVSLPNIKLWRQAVTASELSGDLSPLHYSTTQSPPVNQHIDAVADTVDPVTAPPHLVSGPENVVTAPLYPVIPLAEPITDPKHTTIAPADIVITPQDPVAATTDSNTAQVEESVTAPVDRVTAPLESVSTTTALPNDIPVGHSLTSEAPKDSCAQEVTPSTEEEVTEDSHEAGSLDMERKEGVTNTWVSVCKKKSKRDRKPQAQTPTPVEVSTPQATSRPAKNSRRRKTPVIYQDDRAMVRQSWEEERVKVALHVPPKRRQHVIGPRGETIRRLCHAYPSVRLTVPPPQDT